MTEATDRRSLTYVFWTEVSTRMMNAKTHGEKLDVVAWALEYKRAWGSERMSMASDRILATLKGDIGVE